VTPAVKSLLLARMVTEHSSGATRHFVGTSAVVLVVEVVVVLSVMLAAMLVVVVVGSIVCGTCVVEIPLLLVLLVLLYDSISQGTYRTVTEP